MFNEAATRHARAAAAAQLNVPSAVLPASSANALPSPQTQAEMENQDTDWVLVLKPVLETWLQNNFLNASSAADVWVSMTEVNVYLRDYVMARFTVSAKDAVRMLTKSWRLPTRVSKKAAAKAAAETAAGKRPSPKMTAAYRYLHRTAYHFYQSTRTKAVSVFATHVNENGGLGTLRRTRGTSEKLEVSFKPRVATRFLQDNLFLKDSDCVAGLVRAVAVILSKFGALHRFKEPGPTAGGPRTVDLRNAFIAMVAT